MQNACTDVYAATNSTTGNSWQDYDLASGHTYKYKVVAMNTNDAMVATSNEETFASVAADSER